MAQHPTTFAVQRQRVSRSPLTIALVSAFWLMATAAPAIAQQTQSVKPPAPRDDPSAPIVMTILLLVILAGATLFVAVFPSKRGHQD